MERTGNHKVAMIFAAGFGTRLRPMTDTMPKALVPVAGKPMLDRLLGRLAAAGYDKAVVNVHHFAGMIRDHIRSHDNCGMEVSISDETDLLRDTGGGLLHARDLLLAALSSPAPANDHPSDSDHFPARDCRLAALSSLSSVRDFLSDRPFPLRDRLGGEGRILLHNVDILSNLDFSLLDSDLDCNGKTVGDGGNARPSDDEATVGKTLVAAMQDDSFATLVVSGRKTSRYLLFDDDMNLVGWMNSSTGQIRSPYLPDGARSVCLSDSPRNADLPRGIDGPAVAGCPELRYSRAYAFSGIQQVSADIFPELEKYAASHGEVFSIIDFYLSICGRIPVRGFVPPAFRVLDLGKPSALASAEDFFTASSR